MTHYIAGLHAVTQLPDHFITDQAGDRSCSPGTELARADHHERQQHQQSKPIERSAAAASATAIRDHPHISLSLVDVRFKLPERVVKVFDHLLSGGIESAPSCVPQFDAFSHQGHVSVSGIGSACAQHQGMRSRINDGQIDQSRYIVPRALQDVGADDGQVAQ